MERLATIVFMLGVIMFMSGEMIESSYFEKRISKLEAKVSAMEIPK